MTRLLWRLATALFLFATIAGCSTPISVQTWDTTDGEADLADGTVAPPNSDTVITVADTATTPDTTAQERWQAAVVASYHSHSTKAAIAILKSGGNAFDAFVAAAVVDMVVGPGGSSLAGHLGAMVYHAASGKIRSPRTALRSPGFTPRS